MRIARFNFPFALLVASFTATLDADAQEANIRFNEQIRPILSEYCFACHGPDSASREADLRLDTRQGAIDSGAIVAGSANDSELIARITSSDPDVVMPPPEFHHELGSVAKQLLERWIENGAPWDEHWAFIAPRKVEFPQPAGVEKWARNPIDHFIFQKLRELDLHPNPPADRYTLARRAALDLTGLPPDPDAVDLFVADRGTEAYTRFIEQMLVSQHAGEHRARYWLDAARYGDTHGMHVDNYREIWPYRNWVIQAFGSNMPFDQFLIEQIAGDLLSDAGLDQLIATGFNRCNITTSEGGAIPEELDVRYMIDRVETTATVFLGLTAGCAVCHNHKFDPISQREFYQLGAFFNNTTQPAMDGNQKDTPPTVALPNAKFRDEWDRLHTLRKQIRTELSQWDSDVRRWWASHPAGDKREHSITADGLVLWLALTEGEGKPRTLPNAAAWATDHPEGQRGLRFGEGTALTADLPQLRSDEPLTVSFWYRTSDRVMETTLFEQTVEIKPEVEVEKKESQNSIEESGERKETKTLGWRVKGGAQGELECEIYDGTGQTVRGKLPDNQPLRPRTWQHVCLRYSGGRSNSSFSILVNGRAVAQRNSTEMHVGPVALAETPLKIGSAIPTGAMSDLRIFRRWVSDEETQLLAEEYRLKKLLASGTSWSDMTPQDQATIRSFHNQVIDPDYQARSRELSATEQRRDFIYSRSTTTPVMQERPSAPRAWVLDRGQYDQRRDEVAAGVPVVLPPLPEGAPRNRLGLAQWLVDPDHPLTARVTVNRLWQSIFGAGLVKSSENFGVMGDRPSHPQLLDWLAVEFIQSGWNVNHMLKLMTMSAAYRQASTVTSEKLGKDPENRFLSRGPRLRLDAEVLRDQALAASGLLQRAVGGKSVRPYQPAGLWKVVAITGSNTRNFKQDSGEALYRRSLYTFWKRTSPPPSMTAFNAPTREQCTVRRERTNTPLQALVLMNDPQFVEAARYLAERTLIGHDEDQARALWMFRAVLSRPASKDDLSELLSAIDAFRNIYQQHPKAAQKLISTGETTPIAELDAVELATWTMAANTLMNRDDFINKE